VSRHRPQPSPSKPRDTQGAAKPLAKRVHSETASESTKQSETSKGKILLGGAKRQKTRGSSYTSLSSPSSRAPEKQKLATENAFQFPDLTKTDAHQRALDEYVARWFQCSQIAEFLNDRYGFTTRTIATILDASEATIRAWIEQGLPSLDKQQWVANALVGMAQGRLPSPRFSKPNPTTRWLFSRIDAYVDFHHGEIQDVIEGRGKNARTYSIGDINRILDRFHAEYVVWLRKHEIEG
jgi:hypothetical protein